MRYPGDATLWGNAEEAHREVAKYNWQIVDPDTLIPVAGHGSLLCPNCIVQPALVISTQTYWPR